MLAGILLNLLPRSDTLFEANQESRRKKRKANRERLEKIHREDQELLEFVTMFVTKGDF